MLVGSILKGIQSSLQMLEKREGKMRKMPQKARQMTTNPWEMKLLILGLLLGCPKPCTKQVENNSKELVLGFH